MEHISEKVFISYAKEDRNYAYRLFSDLQNRNIPVWFDELNLLPGSKWEIEIIKAVKNSRYFLALISHNSISKRGFVQKELRLAIEVLDQMPEDQIFLIPVRLNNAIPSMYRLKEHQWVDMYPEWQDGLNKLLSVLKPPIQEIFRIDPKINLIEWGVRPKTHEDLIQDHHDRCIDGDKVGHIVTIWASIKNPTKNQNIQTAKRLILESLNDQKWDGLIYFPPNLKIVDNNKILIYPGIEI